MKKTCHILIILMSLAACTSTSDADTEDATMSGFHFIPKHGSINQPISFFKEGKTYHFFYTTGSDQWQHATSNNLVHWNTVSPMELPGNAMGDVVLDVHNTSGLSATSKAPWIAIFNDDGNIKIKYTNDSGTNWNDKSADLPERVNGNPKIAWYHPTRKWIMTVTNEQEIVILSSGNLKEWKKKSDFQSPHPAIYSELLTLGNQWGLLFSGKTSQYQIGNFDGVSFTPEHDGMVIDWGEDLLDAITYLDQNRTLLIGRIGNNSFTSVRELTQSINPAGEHILLGFPVHEFTSQFTSKRRSKINILRSKEPSWFSFPVESIASSLEILITSGQEEFTVIKWVKELGTITADINSARQTEKGSKMIKPYSSNLKNIHVDLLIDYNSIELFINKGEFQLTLPVTSTAIYDRVEIKVDSKKYSAKAILYNISTSPLTQ